MPTTYWTFLVATLAISGVPLFAGFFSKDEILAGAYEGPLGQPWLYWLGTFTAALTAFYMFRALHLTFHGESRMTPELEHHAHESSSKMTGPLVVLAIFSVVAGYLSWPKPLGGEEMFDRFLAPVFGRSEQVLSVAAAHHAEGFSPGVLMLFSVIAAGFGILIATWFYLKSTDIPQQLGERFSGLYRVLVRKYYMDEFYDWLIVNPLRSGSEKILWRALDAGAIDKGGVEGTAHAAAGVGGILRRIQSGNIRSYAAWVLLGAVAWLAFLLFRH